VKGNRTDLTQRRQDAKRFVIRDSRFVIGFPLPLPARSSLLPAFPPETLIP
jgi:hypothetical protein